jgi:alkyl hydroperoxide reductase 1
MAPLKAGDKFPSGVQFDWVPIVDDDPTNCGRPQTYEVDKEWNGKKVVLVSVPGAFTPGCQARHLPPYIEQLSALKSKGVDIVAFIAYNDGWVMSAWGKVNKVKGDDILFLGDNKTYFAKNHAWTAGPERNARFAIVIEKDGTVSYAENETTPGEISVSNVESVLSKL